MPNIYLNEWPPRSPEDEERKQGSLVAARLLAAAAFTAPKAGGVDQIEINIVYGHEEQAAIARKMEELAKGNKRHLYQSMFKSEAVMAREADAILFIGNYRAGGTPLDLGCGVCAGRADCEHVYSKRSRKYGQIDLADSPDPGTIINGPLCAMRTTDLGFAVGSVLYLANRLFVDARPFMSMGVAGQHLGYCPNSLIVVGVPIATTSKNPFVDILPDYHLFSRDRVIDSTRKTYVTARMVNWFDYRNWYPKAGNTPLRKQRLENPEAIEAEAGDEGEED